MDKNLLLMNAVAIILALGAVAMALLGVHGWGWFLACSLLSSVTSYKK